jgi:hypothetical protein
VHYAALYVLVIPGKKGEFAGLGWKMADLENRSKSGDYLHFLLGEKHESFAIAQRVHFN